MATTASAHIGQSHYQVTITAGKNTLVADEGVENGGKEEGFNPHQLFIASLGACTCATVRMYADKKQMKLNEVKVTLTLEKDEGNNRTNINRQLEFIGDLTEAERARLLEIANRCPIHKIMSNPINITTEEMK